MGNERLDILQVNGGSFGKSSTGILLRASVWMQEMEGTIAADHLGSNTKARSISYSV